MTFANPPPPLPPLPPSNMLYDKVYDNGTAVQVANVLASYSVSICMSCCIRCHELKLDLCVKECSSD